MSAKGTVVVAGFVLVVGAFLGGYLPQHRLRTAAEQDTAMVRAQLVEAEARVRMSQLLGQVLTLRDLVMRQNFGQAQDLSTSFFDGVRTEAGSTPREDFRDVLNDVLSRRDAITASLTKADPAIVETLHQIEVRMRRASGYSVPPDL